MDYWHGVINDTAENIVKRISTDLYRQKFSSPSIHIGRICEGIELSALAYDKTYNILGKHLKKDTALEIMDSFGGNSWRPKNEWRFARPEREAVSLFAEELQKRVLELLRKRANEAYAKM